MRRLVYPPHGVCQRDRACNAWRSSANKREMRFGCFWKVFLLPGAFCLFVVATRFWLPGRLSTGNARDSPLFRVATAARPRDSSPLRDESLVSGGEEVKKRLWADSDCAAQRPAYLFVIRIAKCASTSIVEVLRGLSLEKGFPFVFHGSGAYNWGQREVESVERVCRSRRAWHNRDGAVVNTVVYARHFYFTLFPGLGSSVRYITFVREPLARVVSSYFYYHFSSKPGIRALVPQEHRREDLARCVVLNHEGCTANLMTKYFCGHEAFCASGSPAALRQAKLNLRHHFLLVGVVEEMEASLRLLALLLPDIFGRQGATVSVPLSNQNERLAEVSEEERQVVAQHNKADIALYAFAVAELRGKLKECRVHVEQ